MKKVLVVTGILALAGIAFGAGLQETGIVEVKAKVVQPLKINTTPVDYGMVVQGTKANWPDRAKFGIVDIFGTSGELIKVEVGSEEGNYVTVNTKEQRPYVLTTGSGATAQEKMTAMLSVCQPGTGSEESQYENGIYGIPNQGKVQFTVAGPLDVAEDQKPGEYTGKVYVRAMYQ